MSWPGGVDLITHLANAMALNTNLKLFLLIPSSTDHLNIRIKEDTPPTYNIRHLATNLALKIFQPKHTRSSVGELKKGLNKKIKIVYYANSLEGFFACLKTLDLNVVMPTTESFGKGFPLPWVGYIWDFQHKYYPKFFSEDALDARDEIFRNTVQEAPAVIVNSEEVKKDATRFYKFEHSKIVVLPFSPEPQPEWFDIDLAKLRTKYDLPDKFLLVSNQFWLHKGHLTAVDAMAELLKDSRYKKIQLICTGKMDEPRKPEYIKQIRDRVAKLKLDKNIRFLGYIPKIDQIGVMRQAQAVVQPTQFEGGRGGGAANNAVALGIPLIVSDISINRELSGDNITFFKAGSPSDLAKKIKKVLKSSFKPKTKRQLILQGKYNQQELCNKLSYSIDLAVRNFSDKIKSDR
jgi:glycosyltransferase involved in cell wall biosynthesis